MTDFEQFRTGLTGYCYRMLGGTLEAEDAVQETFLRGWRNLSRQHGNLKSWLYAIATNVCFDMLRSAQRRAVVMDISEPSPPGTTLGEPLPENVWIQPIPDSRVLDPAELVTKRESIRFAFIAALQYLPPKQRVVLILREVLAWQANEVAELLDTTVASINSALQRARATLAARPTAPPLDRDDEELVARYMKAFMNYDLDALVSLLHEDATMTMPPFTWWMRGRDNLIGALRGAGMEGVCQASKFVPAPRTNGLPAFGQYFNGEPFALLVVEVVDGRVAGSTTFLQAKELFPIFGLSTDEFRHADPS